MGVPHTGRRPTERAWLSRLPAHPVRLPVDAGEGRNGSARVWLRVRHPHHDGRQHNHQVRAARVGAPLGHALGEQGCVPAVHRARHRPRPRDTLHRLRVPYGEDLHAAAVCFPPDVLHDPVGSKLAQFAFAIH